MNFCAWRDQIVAERELQKVVEQREREHPERTAGLEARIAKWKSARDASCEKSARREWDGCSMRPAAQAICAAAATKKMTKKLSSTAGELAAELAKTKPRRSGACHAARPGSAANDASNGSPSTQL